MVKHIIALLVLSIAIILGITYAQNAIQLLLTAHDWVSQALTEVFTGGRYGNLARELIAIITIPLLVAFIPAFFYYILRRQFFPYFMDIVWILWLVQVGALLSVSRAITG